MFCHPDHHQHWKTSSILVKNEIHSANGFQVDFEWILLLLYCLCCAEEKQIKSEIWPVWVHVSSHKFHALFQGITWVAAKLSGFQICLEHHYDHRQHAQHLHHRHHGLCCNHNYTWTWNVFFKEKIFMSKRGLLWYQNLHMQKKAVERVSNLPKYLYICKK